MWVTLCLTWLDLQVVPVKVHAWQGLQGCSITWPVQKEQAYAGILGEALNSTSRAAWLVSSWGSMQSE